MDKINVIERKLSIVTGKNTLVDFVEFKEFPVFIGCTSKDKKYDLLANLKFMICKTSGCIQAYNLMPLDTLYSGKYAEALGGKWATHHISFSEFISKNNEADILEVGGSNGSLAKLFCDSNNKVKWTIIEPNKSNNPFKHKNINFINSYFNKDLNFEKGRTVVHSHVFEHIYQPILFFNDVSKYLEEGGRHIFSIPNLPLYLKNNYSNTINFEHTFYYTEELMDYIIALNKFKIIDKFHFENHSIFYALEKNTYIKPLPIPNQFSENKKAYQNFLEYFNGVVNALNNFIDKNPERDFFLFGGHIFSQFLIYLGLDENKINCILDNSDEKKGLRLYGSKLLVNDPSLLKDYPHSTVIVFVGQYQKEIEEQIYNLNPKTKFINPQNYLDI